MAKRKKPVVDRRADLFGKFMHIQSSIIDHVEWIFDDVTGNFDIRIIGNAQVKDITALKELICGIAACDQKNSKIVHGKIPSAFLNRVFTIDFHSDLFYEEKEDVEDAEEPPTKEVNSLLDIVETNDGAIVTVEIGNIDVNDLVIAVKKKLLIIRDKNNTFLKFAHLTFTPTNPHDIVAINGIATINLQRSTS